MSAPTLHRHSFSTMGTEAEILLLGARRSDAWQAFALAETLAATWMSTFNRFDGESELCRLNAAGRGQVSEYLFSAIVQAVEAARISLGVFNPLLLPALIAAGYDRSFERLPSDSIRSVRARPGPAPEEIVIDSARGFVELPDGCKLDLGGLAKGLFADELARLLSHWQGGIVSVGGDMRIWGEGPDNGSWAVGVERPACGRRDVAVVLLNDGGIATSGTNRRTWRRDDNTMHHLIDPRTGEPAALTAASVTAIASAATLAEIAATALFIDQGLATHEPLSSQLWGVIVVDNFGCGIYEQLDSEASFSVYLDA